MKAQGLLTHTAARYMVLAPLVGAFATGYGLCRAFLRSDTAGATWSTAVEGIIHASVATVALVLVCMSLLLAYSFLRRR